MSLGPSPSGSRCEKTRGRLGTGRLLRWAMLSTALMLTMATSGQAAILAAYDFENADGLNSVDTAVNSVAGPLVLNSGLNENASGTVGGGAVGVRTDRGETNMPAFVAGTNDMSVGFTLFNAETANAGAARAAGDYFSLTVNADPGSFLDLTQLSFRTALSNITGVTRNWVLDYAIEGGAFVNNFASGNFTGPQTTPDNTLAWTAFSVDLSSPVFGSLESITFRFVQFGDSSALNHGAFYDKIQLTGDVTAIPEPGTYALCAGIAVFLVWRRKNATSDAR